MSYNDGNFNSKINEIKNRATEIQNFCYKFNEYAKGGFEEIASKIETKKADLDEPLYVMIVGDGNRGKSTLLNGLFSQNIADVSLIPKTWKIDVFQSTDEENYAELEYIRNGNVSKEKHSFNEAKKICLEKEKENEKNKNVESWQSDLRCAKWYVKSKWPSSEIAIVDTPGFSQLRADTSLKNINLFGASGIQLTRDDGFSYYYYRANVVLWCIDSGKLQDGEALEKLKEVNKEKKTTIGIITKMDKIPSERWNEVLKKANETYGAYIDKFLFSAAGAKDEKLKEETLNIIRKEIERLTKEKGQNIKIEEAHNFMNERVDEIDNIITKSGDVFADNCIIYNDILGKIDSGVNNHYSKLKNDVAVYLKNKCKEALARVDSAYDKCDGSEDRFKMYIDSAIGSSETTKKVGEMVSNSDSNLKHYIDNLFNSAKWKTAVLGKAYSNSSLTLVNTKNSISATTGGSISYVQMSDSYAGVGVGVGIASALAGAAVLGPIGLIAGGIGYLVAKVKQRNDWTRSARNAIENVFSDMQREFSKRIEANRASREKAFKSKLEEIFRSLNGGTLNEIEKRLYMMDESLNSISKNTNGAVSFFYNRTNIGHSKFYYKLLKVLPQKREEQKKNAELYLKDCFNKIINKRIEPIRKQILAMNVVEFSYVNPLCKQIGFSGFPVMSEVYKDNETKAFGITEQLNNDMLTLGLAINIKDVFARVSEEKFENLKKSYKDIVDKWDSKINNGIGNYIENLVGSLANEVANWQKECARIIESREYKNVDMLDFSKYFSKHCANNALAQDIYNSNSSVIKKDMFNWKYSNGTSCEKTIIDTFNKVVRETKKSIKDSSDGYKYKWDIILENYCKEKIQQKFNELKSDSKYFSVKEILKNISAPVSEHIAEEESLVRKYERMSLMRGADDVFSYIDEHIVSEKFSDEILCNDFINDDILKTAFNKQHLESKRKQICNDARKKFSASIRKYLNEFEPSVTPTKGTEIALAIIMGIIKFVIGALTFEYGDHMGCALIMLLLMVVTLVFATGKIRGKHSILICILSLLSVFLRFACKFYAATMVFGILFVIIGIIGSIINRLYYKEISETIVSVPSPKL